MGHTFEKIVKDFAKKKIRVWFVFDRSGLIKEVGIEWFHESCHDAVQHCLAYDNSHVDENIHQFENIETKKEPLTVGPLSEKNEGLVGLLLSAAVEEHRNQEQEDFNDETGKEMKSPTK